MILNRPDRRQEEQERREWESQYDNPVSFEKFCINCGKYMGRSNDTSHGECKKCGDAIERHYEWIREETAKPTTWRVTTYSPESSWAYEYSEAMLAFWEHEHYDDIKYNSFFPIYFAGWNGCLIKIEKLKKKEATNE